MTKWVSANSSLWNEANSAVFLVENPIEVSTRIKTRVSSRSLILNPIVNTIWQRNRIRLSINTGFRPCFHEGIF
jgi:hypothetical protein